METGDSDKRRLRPLRIYAGPVLWVVLGISFVWTTALVVAPLTINPDSVTGLNGRANQVDYSDIWGKLPPLQGFVYLLGDIECHQKSSRTIFINHNEMPVCARDASIFFFLTLGLVFASIIKPEAYVSKAVVRGLPARVRLWLGQGSGPIIFTWVIGVLSLMPLAIDGGLQLVTSYESTNVVRFLTGIPAGTFVGLVLGLMIQSIHVLVTSQRLGRLQQRHVD